MVGIKDAGWERAAVANLDSRTAMWADNVPSHCEYLFFILFADLDLFLAPN